MGQVQFEGLRKSFGDVVVLQGLNLEIKNGEFIVFVGPSGCGKSTLLRCIAGLEEITEGQLLIDGKVVNEVPPSKRSIAMVFQSYALYPHMTVAENMAFSLKLAGVAKDEIAKAVKLAARILQIEPLLDRKPKTLSGGQRQRVAIGRAIVRKPEVFLFDEPLSNLDAALRVKMRVELARLHAELKTTMIYVTHDQVEAMTLANRIVVMNQGRLEQVGAPLELYHHPANLFVAGFIGSPSMNFLPCTLVGSGTSGARIKLRDGTEAETRVETGTLAVGSKLTLGIRPEWLVASPGPGASGTPGTVQVAEHLGDLTFLYVLAPAAPAVLTVKCPPENSFRSGNSIKLSFPAEHCFLFDGQGRTLPQR